MGDTAGDGAAPPHAKRARCADSTETARASKDVATPQADGSTVGTNSDSDPVDGLSSYEEFRSTLGYFFTLFRKDFPESLEKATREQWKQLQMGDAAVHEDGQNNPVVQFRLQPIFGAQMCDALEDAEGKLPTLEVPRTAEQVSFWSSQLRHDHDAAAWDEAAKAAAAEELSERTSHIETIRDALAWYARSAHRDRSSKLRVFVLGASARYEYGCLDAAGENTGDRLAEALASRLLGIAEDVVPGSDVTFFLCGRDVPGELHGREHRCNRGSTSVLLHHRVGYLHDLVDQEVGLCLTGGLFVALHGGLGLDHPELSASWPPTLQKIRNCAPAWLAVTSFNLVEHEIAEATLKTAFPQQLEVDNSGANRAGSLAGIDSIGPFDGIQGKRNYGVLHARVVPLKQTDEGWDLFD